MDSSILQLFAMEEILERISRRRLTGCFHAFNSKAGAAIFFKDGVVVAGVKGQEQGETVLLQIMDWKNARYVWQADATTVATPDSKPLDLRIPEFLAKHRPHKSPLASKPAGTPTSTVSVVQIGLKGKATGPVPIADRPVTPPKPVDLTATKTMNQSAEDRAAQDEALLKKHKLVLIATDNTLQRHRLAKVNNLVGRSPACDISIVHPSISRQHCILQITDRGLHVKDLETTNGTKVNGIVMKEGYISDGDKLSIGFLTFLLSKE